MKKWKISFFEKYIATSKLILTTIIDKQNNCSTDLNLSEQNPLRQKQNPCVSILACLESYLVSDILPIIIKRLIGDSFGQRHTSYSSRLSAGYLRVPCFHQVLRQLGALSTASVACHDRNLKTNQNKITIFVRACSLLLPLAHRKI